MTKQVLMTIGNVRIVQNDDLNMMVERLEEVFNPKDRITSEKWRFKGYYGTILKALRSIVMNEWLIDKSSVIDLESHLKRVKESNGKIFIAINQLEQSSKEILEVMKT